MYEYWLIPPEPKEYVAHSCAVCCGEIYTDEAFKRIGEEIVCRDCASDWRSAPKVVAKAADGYSEGVAGKGKQSGVTGCACESCGEAILDGEKCVTVDGTEKVRKKMHFHAECFHDDASDLIDEFFHVYEDVETLDDYEWNAMCDAVGV